MLFDPRDIPNNFRRQSFIEQGLREAKTLLETKTDDTLTSVERVKLALIYMESGNKDLALKYASLASAAEGEAVAPLNENKATALYVLATLKRETNCFEEALANCAQAQQLAESNWLKSNLLRNIGLVHLTEKRFEAAYRSFQEAYNLVSQCGEPALRGSLPALSNYSALAFGREALASGKDSSRWMTLFDETSQLYETIFKEKEISPEIACIDANDYISHCVHRVMILCERSEKYPLEDHDENLLHAEKELLKALETRQKNKVGEQRLGDTCEWLGRVYERLNRNTEAMALYKKAKSYYETVLPPNAPKIVNIQKLLNHLTIAAVDIASLTSNSSFKAHSNINIDQELISQEDSSTTVFNPGMGMNKHETI